ncbi:hypothetical protein BTA51_29390 [Hahella sp. CCB-MM4]|uniref:hypothetical protein n=1 Tax=Hahella sp. (strain CCB-MM4) TaxID=1926491 RepID=UPI000B9AB2E1|nr:hypothetical protein [Hahella sp. CCB-MM4]OZG69740.1 hypothetical protein BTA51_29390 [Hahella sp. CCB-MM4]
MIEPRTGNYLSSCSNEAVELYNQAIDLILGSQSGAAQALDRALKLDGHFALAAAARYFVEKDIGGPDANRFLSLATESAVHASEWEREHIDILFGFMTDAGNTIDRARAYLKTNPGDLLIVSQLSSYLIFYGGPNKLTAVLNLLESVGQGRENDWAFLARLGFAASEAGDRQRGRTLIERALELRPESLYSIHALAHLLHDEGEAEESTRVIQRWLSEYEGSARDGQMYSHVQWHLALSEWQTGERDNAIKRYTEFCSPDVTTCGPVLALADCGGFLLRDYLATGKATALPKDALEHIERFWTMISHPFIALHIAGLYASAEDSEGLEKCVSSIVGSPTCTSREVSLALVSALRDFVAKDYKHAAMFLASISLAARIGIGGSNVERILIDLIEEHAKDRSASSSPSA